MARNDAVSEAAVFGLVGTVLMSLGGLIASFLLSRLDVWVALLLAIPIWLVFLYFGMKQFAHGVYTLVEDTRA